MEDQKLSRTNYSDDQLLIQKFKKIQNELPTIVSDVEESEAIRFPDFNPEMDLQQQMERVQLNTLRRNELQLHLEESSSNVITPRIQQTSDTQTLRQTFDQESGSENQSESAYRQSTQISIQEQQNRNSTQISYQPDWEIQNALDNLKHQTSMILQQIVLVNVKIMIKKLDSILELRQESPLQRERRVIFTVAEAILIQVVDYNCSPPLTTIREYLNYEDVCLIVVEWAKEQQLEAFCLPDALQSLFSVMDVDKDGLVSELDLNEFLYLLLHADEKQPYSVQSRIDNAYNLRPNSYSIIELEKSPQSVKRLFDITKESVSLAKRVMKSSAEGINLAFANQEQNDYLSRVIAKNDSKARIEDTTFGFRDSSFENKSPRSSFVKTRNPNIQSKEMFQPSNQSVNCKVSAAEEEPLFPRISSLQLIAATPNLGQSYHNRNFSYISMAETEQTEKLPQIPYIPSSYKGSNSNGTHRLMYTDFFLKQNLAFNISQQEPLDLSEQSHVDQDSQDDQLEDEQDDGYDLADQKPVEEVKTFSFVSPNKLETKDEYQQTSNNGLPATAKNDQPSIKSLIESSLESSQHQQNNYVNGSKSQAQGWIKSIGETDFGFSSKKKARSIADYSNRPVILKQIDSAVVQEQALKTETSFFLSQGQKKGDLNEGEKQKKVTYSSIAIQTSEQARDVCVGTTISLAGGESFRNNCESNGTNKYDVSKTNSALTCEVNQDNNSFESKPFQFEPNFEQSKPLAKPIIKSAVFQHKQRQYVDRKTQKLKNLKSALKQTNAVDPVSTQFTIQSDIELNLQSEDERIQKPKHINKKPFEQMHKTFVLFKEDHVLRDEEQEKQSNISVHTQIVEVQQINPLEVTDYFNQEADRQIRKLERNYTYMQSSITQWNKSSESPGNALNSNTAYIKMGSNADKTTEFDLKLALKKQIEMELQPSSEIWGTSQDPINILEGNYPMNNTLREDSQEGLGLPRHRMKKKSIITGEGKISDRNEGALLRYTKQHQVRRRSKDIKKIIETKNAPKKQTPPKLRSKSTSPQIPKQSKSKSPRAIQLKKESTVKAAKKKQSQFQLQDVVFKKEDEDVKYKPKAIDWGPDPDPVYLSASSFSQVFSHVGKEDSIHQNKLRSIKPIEPSSQPLANFDSLEQIQLHSVLDHLSSYDFKQSQKSHKSFKKVNLDNQLTFASQRSLRQGEGTPKFEHSHQLLFSQYHLDQQKESKLHKTFLFPKYSKEHCEAHDFTQKKKPPKKAPKLFKLKPSENENYEKGKSPLREKVKSRDRSPQENMGKRQPIKLKHLNQFKSIETSNLKRKLRNNSDLKVIDNQKETADTISPKIIFKIQTAETNLVEQKQDPLSKEFFQVFEQLTETEMTKSILGIHEEVTNAIKPQISQFSFLPYKQPQQLAPLPQPPKQRTISKQKDSSFDRKFAPYKQLTLKQLVKPESTMLSKISRKKSEEYDSFLTKNDSTQFLGKPVSSTLITSDAEEYASEKYIRIVKQSRLPPLYSSQKGGAVPDLAPKYSTSVMQMQREASNESQKYSILAISQPLAIGHGGHVPENVRNSISHFRYQKECQRQSLINQRKSAFFVHRAPKLEGVSKSASLQFQLLQNELQMQKLENHKLVQVIQRDKLSASLTNANAKLKANWDYMQKMRKKKEPNDLQSKERVNDYQQMQMSFDSDGGSDQTIPILHSSQIDSQH